MTDAISTATHEFCQACKIWKQCKMYILQNGYTAWICTQCRNGVPPAYQPKAKMK